MWNESHIILHIDLERALAGLAERDFELLVLRNVLGLGWREIAIVTERNKELCRRDYRALLHALALWLRSYSIHAEVRLRFRHLRRRRARRKS